MNKIEENKKNMKKFYDEIANKYDYIFPLNETQKKFLLEEIEGKKVLDVGAATGKLDIFLKENGYDIISIDINDKLIEKAFEKGVKVQNVDMLKIDEAFKNELFSTIINIGNTLPHLNSKEDIRTFFEKSYNQLENNGKLIIQLINFHKFINQNDENNYLGNLPLIKNENVKFERNYYLDEKQNIVFKTILDDKLENEETLQNILLPEIEEIMKKEGFKNIKVYGGFNKSEFDYENSLFLVITTVK